MHGPSVVSMLLAGDSGPANAKVLLLLLTHLPAVDAYLKVVGMYRQLERMGAEFGSTIDNDYRTPTDAHA